MTLDIRHFLAGLFNVGPSPTGLAMVSEPQVSGNAKAGMVTAGSPTVIVDAPEPARGLFAGWVLRPDVSGRLGWEAQTLPEATRWWAQSTFETLPDIPKGFCLGGSTKPAHQDHAACVPVDRVDTLDLGQRRPVQGHFQGLGGA